MTDAERMRKPIKNQAPSFADPAVSGKKTTHAAPPPAQKPVKHESDAEKMRKTIKDQTPSFGKAGLESHKPAATHTASSGHHETDSQKMRKPIPNQTPSFGRADLK